jgi:hypothetical protein
VIVDNAWLRAGRSRVELPVGEIVAMTVSSRVCALLLLLPCHGVAAAEDFHPAPPACENVFLHADRGWMVFFGSESAELTPRARTISKELASAFLEDHGQFMVLDGSIDRAEAVGNDTGLGRRRAEAVAEVMREAGIQADRPIVRDAGSARPLAPQQLGAAEPQNRLVQVQPMGMVSESHQRAVEACGTWIRENCFAPLTAGNKVLCERALNIILWAR